MSVSKRGIDVVLEVDDATRLRASAVAEGLGETEVLRGTVAASMAWSWEWVMVASGDFGQ